jgi:hypothetical protein
VLKLKENFKNVMDRLIVMEGNIKNLVQPAEAAPHVGLSTFLDLG